MDSACLLKSPRTISSVDLKSTSETNSSRSSRELLVSKRADTSTDVPACSNLPVLKVFQIWRLPHRMWWVWVPSHISQQVLLLCHQASTTAGSWNTVDKFLKCSLLPCHLTRFQRYKAGASPRRASPLRVEEVRPSCLWSVASQSQLELHYWLPWQVRIELGWEPCLWFLLWPSLSCQKAVACRMGFGREIGRFVAVGSGVSS